MTKILRVKYRQILALNHPLSQNHSAGHLRCSYRRSSKRHLEISKKTPLPSPLIRPESQPASVIEEQPDIHRIAHSKQRLSKPYTLSLPDEAKARYRRVRRLADIYYKPLDSLSTLQNVLIGCTGCVLFAALIIYDIHYTLSMSDPGREIAIAVVSEATGKAAQDKSADEDPAGIISKANETTTIENPKARLVRLRKDLAKTMREEKGNRL